MHSQTVIPYLCIVCVSLIHLPTHRCASFISKCSSKSVHCSMMVKREETSAHFTLSGLQRVPPTQIAGFRNARVDTPKTRVPMGMLKAPVSPSNGTKTFGYQRSTLQQVSRSVLLQYPGCGYGWVMLGVLCTCSYVMTVSILYSLDFPWHLLMAIKPS